VALARDLSDPYTYNAQALRDPLIRELARQVKIEAGSPPRVVIDLDGHEHVLEASDFPSMLDFAAAADKLRRYAHISEVRLCRLVQLVERLDALDDMSQLAGAIAA
jgi:hypothetical protein